MFGLVWGLLGSFGKTLFGTSNKRGILNDLVGAYSRLRHAETEEERNEIEREIEEIKALRDLQLASSRNFLSPMMVGQYLVVVPYGLWFASIIFVSICNANFGWSLTILDLPPRIHDMARILVPAILIGQIFTRR